MTVTFTEEVPSQAMDSSLLGLAADTLDDIEALRKATANRVGAMTRSTADKDGEVRGLGLMALGLDTDVDKAVEMLESIKQVEHQQILQLQRLMRKHPLGPFVKSRKGLGEKTIARLIAAVGDPYWADRTTKTSDGKIISVDSGPRTLREFLSYAGYGIGTDGAARRVKKGMTQTDLFKLGNPKAKMRAYVVAEPIIKGKGPYRDVYDVARMKYADAIHTVDCVRCGPSGKPAEAGTLLSNGHQHARAIRAVSKAVLTDLYFAAKEWHESGENVLRH